jgi:hypothetical protein
LKSGSISASRGLNSAMSRSFSLSFFHLAQSRARTWVASIRVSSIYLRLTIGRDTAPA